MGDHDLVMSDHDLMMSDHDLVLGDHDLVMGVNKLKVCEIADAMSTSNEWVQNILFKHFNKKMSADRCRDLSHLIKYETCVVFQGLFATASVESLGLS